MIPDICNPDVVVAVDPNRGRCEPNRRPIRVRIFRRGRNRESATCRDDINTPESGYPRPHPNTSRARPHRAPAENPAPGRIRFFRPPELHKPTIMRGPSRHTRLTIEFGASFFPLGERLVPGKPRNQNTRAGHEPPMPGPSREEPIHRLTAVGTRLRLAAKQVALIRGKRRCGLVVCGASRLALILFFYRR